MKVLLAVGSAPCIHDDVDKALGLYPAAELMLINGACSAIEHAGHVLAGHTAKAEEFAAARRAAFPHAVWRLHANWNVPRKGIPRSVYPSVTDWWGPEVSSGATSAGKAAMIGLAMGFERIVLCGCPMDGSGYTFDEAQVSQDPACRRVGDPKAQNVKIIKRYRDTMARLAQTTFKGRVFSMSGFTKQVLGAP